MARAVWTARWCAGDQPAVHGRRVELRRHRHASERQHPRHGADHSYSDTQPQGRPPHHHDRFEPRRARALSRLTLHALTKPAHHAFTRGLARELVPDNITENLIQPGPIDTNLNPADGTPPTTIATWRRSPVTEPPTNSPPGSR
ncbi:MAG: SDR family oxidoreductase [Oxalobacteraceae bacterium]|nr:MAG: SDR family oxidoreductase [Oxalobacteraceae bacterium]